MHEQNNKITKVSVSVRHLVNKSESGLIRWETVGTGIARFLTEFKNSINSPKSNKTRKHDTFQETFLKDVQRVYDELVANPLNLPEMTNISNTSSVLFDIIFHNIPILEVMGKS